MRRHCGIARLEITMAGLVQRDKGGLQRLATGSETRRRSDGKLAEEWSVELLRALRSSLFLNLGVTLLVARAC
jgi:hypothetical protein